MASKEAAEENGGCNTETEEETIALQKKRSRRVSFAETTAIHLFIRDEEYETPPDGAGNSSSEGDGRPARSESDEIMELLQSSDDEFAGAGDDAGAVRSSFLRPMESPSPGSGFGSATSNDEDNFFGPVSMDFIKPGRLSDSAASDENHDITMDSTAFSMHFRSLAGSDSVGDSKTPTGIRLAFGERTPGQISTANSVGDLMVLTTGRKPASHSSFPLKVNDSGHSDDMSLVSENPHRYDYGKLPPELDVLLAEGGKDVGPVPFNSHVSSLKKDAESTPDQKRHELLDVADDRDADILEKSSALAISAARRGFLVPGTLVESPYSKSDNLDDDPVTVLPIDNQGTSFDKDDKSRKIVTETSENFESPSSRTQPNLNVEHLTGSFDAGSVSSLLAERRKIFKVSVNSSNDEWNLIPLAKELSDKGSIKNVCSTSRFAKGVSRLKRLEAFPFASTSKAEGTAARLIPSSHSFTCIAKNNLSGYGDSNDISINNVDAPVICLDAHFSDVAKDNGEFRSKISNNVWTSVGNNEHAMATEGIKDLRSSCFTTGLPSPGRSRKIIKTMYSPSLTGSQKKELDHHVSKDNHAKVTEQSTGSDSSLLEFTFNKYSRVAGMSDNSAFPSDTGSENLASASSQYPENLSINLSQRGQSHLRLCQNVAPEDAGIFASGTEASMHLLSDNKLATNVFSSDVEHPKLVAQGSQVQNENSMLSIRSGLVPSLCFQTVPDKASESCKLPSLDDDVWSGSMLTSTAQLTQCRKAIAGSTGAFHRPNVSPLGVLDNPKGDLSFSLSHKEPSAVADNARMYRVREDVPTPRLIQLTSKDDNDDKLSSKQYYVCGIDSSSGRKRKHQGFVDEAEHHHDENLAFQHKLQLHKDQNHLEEGRKISCNIGDDVKLRHWADVTSGFRLSSYLSFKGEQAMEKLDDILVHLEQMKSYEHLYHNICAQKTFDVASCLQNKRVMDLKSLLYRTAYKKAKLQFLHLKRDKLLDQIQQLNSRLQDSETLMSSFLCSHIHGQKDVQVDCIQPESCPIAEDIRLGPIEILSPRKELELSDRKINNLKESFYTYIKVVKEPSRTSITEIVKDFLKKRISCRSLRSELQLWEIESLKVKNGQQSFLFNHLGFLSQRFIVKLNSSSIMSISKELNNSKISKMFHNMDACTAFSFVFGSETSPKFAGLKTIAHETQKTNSVLHNLLDVVEEVELARMELRNLTHSRFSQLSAGKLDLQLCFSDFKSRVNLSIDVTCLNRGVYPSHALPYEVQGRAAGKEESFQILLSNIKTGLRGLRCGYMRIINICRCVSKMMRVEYDMT
ncbi:hypothetical protein Cgig2_025580 [Carnegiea gigantea]|uniref:Uncharacterized protein n=1 Tax=Carnegiea gigantea TaxID=171969 RepID=A0A9Q1JY18_9CARY|nr:hypothetical protein Cgig2_025580 [Carnegiea gigantea]